MESMEIQLIANEGFDPLFFSVNRKKLKSLRLSVEGFFTAA